MSNIIIHNRSSLPHTPPSASQLRAGEIAINDYHGRIYTYASESNSVIQLAALNVVNTGSLQIAGSTISANTGSFGHVSATSIIGDSSLARQLNPRLVLPSTIPVAQGRELNLWWDSVSFIPGIFPGVSYHSNGPGENMQRSYRFSPAGIASEALEITVLDLNRNVIASASTTIQTVSTGSTYFGEIISNGDFNNGTSSWSPFSTPTAFFVTESIGNLTNVLFVSGANQNQGAKYDGLAFDSGSAYSMSIDIYKFDTRVTRILVQTSDTGETFVNDSTSTSLGLNHKEFAFTPATSSNSIRFWIYNAATAGPLSYFGIDNVSIQKENGVLNMLFIGDSLTYQGYITSEVRNLVNLSSSFDINLIGTQGTFPNLHEGVSGKTFAYFSGSTSPFYNTGSGQLDFQNYMNVHGFTGSLDFVNIMLGINDCFTQGTEFEQSDMTPIINRAKVVIDAILDSNTGFPSCSIILTMPPIGCNTRDGFSDDYDNNAFKEYYEKNIRLLWENLYAEFDSGSYHPNVHLCSAGMWVDRYYGYPLNTFTVSARNSTSVERHTNALHPATNGYYQIADGIYSMLMNLI